MNPIRCRSTLEGAIDGLLRIDGWNTLGDGWIIGSDFGL
jgi:hypothetical protein